jgi:hypothetical protein
LTEKPWRIHSPIFEADAIIPNYRVWPWNGHRLFAYDLIAFLAPKFFVELGTYWGTSLFAFSQAVKDLQLPTRCVAIDTWEGDDHTGKYENNVYETVQEIASTVFGGIDIHLIKGFFINAVEDFADNSIELLHIDGLHTYEAVKEDFTTWLPKLAENGVILFHDIADSCDYGSVRYWHELLADYPGFSFQHSWGLGVLFPKGERHLVEMRKNNLVDKMDIYCCRSEYNLLAIQKDDGVKWRQQQDELIKRQEKELAALQARIANNDKELHRIHSSWQWRVLKRLKLSL